MRQRPQRQLLTKEANYLSILKLPTASLSATSWHDEHLVVRGQGPTGPSTHGWGDRTTGVCGLRVPGFHTAPRTLHLLHQEGEKRVGVHNQPKACHPQLSW